ncbi:MAG: PilZ domain-containing protein [Nitrospirales bacterium]|nr:PilZ domain-containing protein [Nitrospira sp.]MDR4500259.1 PilZ domain-containing protein [Nitrospirales bacterium]
METTQVKPKTIKGGNTKSEAVFQGKDRRDGFRARVVHGLNLESELRCSKNKVWPSKALNLSQQGVLLEFPKGSVPSVIVDDKVSVKLCCHEDIVWVPGVVRHQRGNRVGIYFPEFMHRSTHSTAQIISRILRAVERGWLRQKAQ